MLFPDNQHRHSQCLNAARKRLDDRARAKSRRLGVNDKRVFEILLSEHRSFSAYEVVDRTEQQDKRLQANQVYRAVETLIELGVVHRVELKNGYMACHSPDECDAQQILICRSCNQVAEMEHARLSRTIAKSAEQAGFLPDPQRLELLGLCANCADPGAQQ
ncbi:MAG: transcriptional repressor [Pseudomonadota bacterium]